MRHTWLTLMFILLSQMTSADTLLAPFKLTYSANYNGLNISAERTLERQPDGGYELKTTADSFLASIAETGLFRLDPNGAIINDSYQYRRNIVGKKKVEHLAFDRKNNLAIYNSKDKQRTVDLTQVPGGAEPFSRLTYQLQLRRDLMNNADQLTYPVISRGRLKLYQFETAGEEMVATKLGNIRAIRVNRIREEKDRETVLWFAPELNFLLIKLWQKEEDEEYQIVLDKGQVNGQPVTAVLNAEDTPD